MRVLILTSAFVPTAGGAETYALNIALGLGQRGHVIKLITNSIAGLPSVEQLSPSVSVSRLHSFHERLSAPDRILWEELQFCLYPEAKEVVRQFQPDLVFSNNLGLSPLAKTISISCEIPWVATFHEQAPEREALGEARLQFAYGVLKPDLILAGSKFYLARAQRYGDPANSHLVYHGIDTDRFRPRPTSGAIRQRYSAPEKSSLVVSAGRLKPRKGFTDLIHAVASLRAKNQDIFLVIAGTISSASAEYRVGLKTLVSTLGISSHFVLDETITQTDMPALLSAADIVVQPSLEEGLGLAVIEAMACERPVVTTRIPGILEVVTRDDIAELVEPGSPDSIANAVQRLLEDNAARTSMGSKARDHVVENFSLASMSEATCSLLQIVLSRHLAGRIGRLLDPKEDRQ